MDRWTDHRLANRHLKCQSGDHPVLHQAQHLRIASSLKAAHRRHHPPAGRVTDPTPFRILEEIITPNQSAAIIVQGFRSEIRRQILGENQDIPSSSPVESSSLPISSSSG